jgi:hypothetical protein
MHSTLLYIHPDANKKSLSLNMDIFKMKKILVKICFKNIKTLFTIKRHVLGLKEIAHTLKLYTVRVLPGKKSTR